MAGGWGMKRGGGEGRWKNARCWCPTGKYAALNAEAILPLLQLTSSALSKARLNAVKALTMLAEAPEGRKFLQAYVHVFRALELDSSKAVRQAAEIATKVIEWEP